MKTTPKILAINGSHRSENGFTEILLQAFLKGVRAAGVQWEILYPAKQNIIACTSCGKCLFETPGICNLNDDMALIIEKIEAADLLIFANPVYFDSMPSHMKKLVERLRSTLDAYFELRNGRTFHLKTTADKKGALTLFTAGNPERESFVTISRIFKRIIDNMGWQLEGELCFPASHLLAAEPERLSGQLEAVTACGAVFASEGTIDPTLLAAANKEYIDDPEETLYHMTRMILKMRQERQTGPAML